MRASFFGIGSAAIFAALLGTASAQDVSQVIVSDYLSAQYYPTIIMSMKFSGDSWQPGGDKDMVFGDWSVKSDNTAMIFARYHPADSDVPQSIEVDGLLCQTGGTGEWFDCYMALADARGLKNSHGDKICAVFAGGKNDDRHTGIECPESLELATPPLPQ